MISLNDRVASLYSRENQDSASVLVFGYINLNVIDGSSFFIAGLGAMLASRVGVSVDILSANKIFSYNVLHELSSVDNVRVIDPFKSHSMFDAGRWGTDHTLSREEAAYAMAEMDRQGAYDHVIVRDVSTARLLVREYPDIGPRLSVYVTGVAFSDVDVDPGILADISSLTNAGVSFILQTEEMKKTLVRAMPNFELSDHVVLGPFVPNSNSEFHELYNYNSQPSRLVYAGKFFPNWLPDRIMSGFNYARITNPSLSLDVAGDAFRADPQNLRFSDEVRYLLNNSAGIEWHGGLPRERVREMVRDSDIGISWRSSSMDYSTEFSTKVLEYGSLGKPSVLNPSQVNRQILGEDYPLYVNNMSEYVQVLRNLGGMADAVEEAAYRCWTVANSHSYALTSELLLEFFGILPAPPQDGIVLDDRDIGISSYLSGTTDQQVPVFNITARSGRISLDTVPSSIYSEPLGTVNDFLSQLYFMQELRKRRADAIAFDEHQHVVDGSGGTVSSVTEDSGRLAQLEAQVEALKAEVRQSRNEAGHATSRLESLRASKLGRIQTWWWRKRN